MVDSLKNRQINSSYGRFDDKKPMMIETVEEMEKIEHYYDI